jgi:hypothetical protein
MYCTEEAGADGTEEEGGPQVLLHEAWAWGIPPEWRVVDDGDYLFPSAWKVDANFVLRQSSNILTLEERSALDKRGTHLVYDGGGSWEDYDFSVNLASTDNDVLGVMFRYQDPDNFYRFSMDRQAAQKRRRLVKCVGGHFTLLAWDDGEYAANSYYTLTISLSGDAIQVLVGGVLVFDVRDTTDDAISSGTIALYSWGNRESFFDEVLVLQPKATALRKLIRPIFGGAESPQAMAEHRLQGLLELLGEEEEGEGIVGPRRGTSTRTFLSAAFAVQEFGIGLGVGVLLACLLCAGCLCLRRRLRRCQELSSEPSRSPVSESVAVVDVELVTKTIRPSGLSMLPPMAPAFHVGTRSG